MAKGLKYVKMGALIGVPLAAGTAAVVVGVQQIKPHNLKAHRAATAIHNGGSATGAGTNHNVINDQFDMHFKPSFTGLNGSGTFAQPTWLNQSGFAEMQYFIGQTSSLTGTEQFTNVIPTNLKNGDYVWMKLVAKANSGKVFDVTNKQTPQRFLIEHNAFAEPVSTSQAIEIKIPNNALHFAGENKKGTLVIDANSKNPLGLTPFPADVAKYVYAVTRPTLSEEKTLTFVEPADTAFTDVAPNNLSFGDLVWVTLKPLPGKEQDPLFKNPIKPARTSVEGLMLSPSDEGHVIGVSGQTFLEFEGYKRAILPTGFAWSNIFNRDIMPGSQLVNSFWTTSTYNATVSKITPDITSKNSSYKDINGDDIDRFYVGADAFHNSVIPVGFKIPEHPSFIIDQAAFDGIAQAKLADNSHWDKLDANGKPTFGSVVLPN